MISLDFYLAVSGFLLLVLIIILFIWVFTKREKDKHLSLDPRFIWHCSVCTYTYVNTKEEVISACPRCGSYNKKNG